MLCKEVSIFVVVIIACTCVYVTSSQTSGKKNGEVSNNTASETLTNDTILEYFYNCSCIPYYLCPVADTYSVAARKGNLPNDLQCSTKGFYCCQDLSETVAREKRRDPFANQTFCGVAKTEISLRILTPDSDSASTIAGEFPWVAEIFRKRGNSHQIECVGSLINPKVIVTTARCVVSGKPESFKVVLTGSGPFHNLGANPENERNVVKIIKHPEYNSSRLINDIALLILDREYNFSNSFLNSICLPEPNSDFDDKRCIAVDLDRNKDLTGQSFSKVDLSVVNSQQCQTFLRNTSFGTDYILDSSILCAGGEADKNTCRGFEGGPLMCLGENYQFVLAGLVSWGVDKKCRIAHQPRLYTNVGKLTDWIDTKLSRNGLIN